MDLISEVKDYLNQDEGGETTFCPVGERLDAKRIHKEIICVSAAYLLGLTETKNHPNADLAELHLSDRMIELLKSRKINNRLLCEMATHKDFVKLLADIEIYVDGIASMQIQSLNTLVDIARVEITDKHYSKGGSARRNGNDNYLP